MDLRAFSGELVWFAPLLGDGNNLESILLISPVAEMQATGMLVLSMGDGILTHLP
jgi:hypothetical protein